MKKQTLTLAVIAAYTGLFLGFSDPMNAQPTLFVPSGTGGIGASSNSNVGIGMSIPAKLL